MGKTFGLLAMAFVALAGCSGGEQDPATDDPAAGMPAGPHGAHAAGAHLLAPVWELGDWWTLDSAQGGAFTHAVSADGGDDWVVDTDSPDIAFFDAQTDISFLGNVRKADLAGSQGSTRVEFLRFPLQPDQSWTTTWDGESITVRTADVRDGRADLVATRADGSMYAEYSYSDQARYFTRFAFYDPTGSEVGFEWRLSQSGGSFAGTLVRWQLETLFETHGAIPTAHASMFPVRAGYTDVWIAAALDCTAGAVTLALGPPTGPAEDRGYSEQGPCPLAEADGYPLAAPTAAEQWGALLSGVPGATTGTLDLVAYGRTAAEFRVGEAPSA